MQVPPNPFTAGAPAGDSRGSSVLNVAGSSGAAAEQLALKEREIRAKERELEKRFEELQNRERALGGVKLKNWPKFYPIVCAFQPPLSLSSASRASTQTQTGRLRFTNTRIQRGSRRLTVI